jgi:hypothetical protein
MFINQDKFTVEEVNLMCIFEADSRTMLIGELTLALCGFYDDELTDIAESAVAKLEKMSDDEFAALKLYPVYGDDDYNEKSEV